jgi:transposase-like protein
MKIMDMKGMERKVKKRRVLRCPQCGSDNITYELGLITGYKYFCKNCQYVGPLVIEDTGGKEQECEKKKD